jgi:hypothetical protein
VRLVEKAKQECLRAEHRSIHGSLLLEYRVFSSEAKQITVQRIGFEVRVALAEIELASFKCRGIARIRKNLLHFRRY